MHPRVSSLEAVSGLDRQLFVSESAREYATWLCWMSTVAMSRWPMRANETAAKAECNAESFTCTDGKSNSHRCVTGSPPEAWRLVHAASK